MTMSCVQRQVEIEVLEVVVPDAPQANGRPRRRLRHARRKLRSVSPRRKRPIPRPATAASGRPPGGEFLAGATDFGQSTQVKRIPTNPAAPALGYPGQGLCRRRFLRAAVGLAAAAGAGGWGGLLAADRKWSGVADQTFDFIRRCARTDGGYAPSPDSSYAGNSDNSIERFRGRYVASHACQNHGLEAAPPRTVN